VVAGQPNLVVQSFFFFARNLHIVNYPKALKNNKKKKKKKLECFNYEYPQRNRTQVGGGGHSYAVQRWY
jgi:hypothetical protein